MALNEKEEEILKEIEENLFKDDPSLAQTVETLSLIHISEPTRPY